MEIIMSQLTNEEQELATQLERADLNELTSNSINMQKLGFNGGITEEGINTHKTIADITNVAYKVMKNKASSLSKAKAKMLDISQRYGRDNKQYDKAQSDYNDALDASKQAELKHQIISNTKREVGQAVVKGMTF